MREQHRAGRLLGRDLVLGSRGDRPLEALRVLIDRRDHPLGRGEVLLHQRRWDEEGIANIVEALSARSVGGEILAGLKSIPKRSRTVLLYSLRFRRRTVLRP